MRATWLLGVALALSACGVPESEDAQASRGAIQGMYFIPFESGLLERSPAWDAALEEYRKPL